MDFFLSVLPGIWKLYELSTTVNQEERYVSGMKA